MTYDDRHRFTQSLFGKGASFVKLGKAAVEAGKFDDALAFYKNALMAFNESRGRDAAKMREQCESAIALLKSKLGVADAPAAPPTLRTGVAKTEPDDLETFYGSVESRRPIEVELRAAKKGNTGT